MTTPARLVAMHTHPERLTWLFDTGDSEVAVSAGIDHDVAHAVQHLHALHAHSPSCQRSPRSQVHVDLLIRTVASMGGRADTLLVRAVGEPAFWLRVIGPDGVREVELDLLDATCLLMSQRVPVLLLGADEADWDRALARLVAGEDGVTS